VPRWPAPRRSTLSVVAVLIVALSTGMTATGFAADAGLPKGVALRSLLVIPLETLASSQDRALVASLQGLVAKSSPEQIFIDDGGPSTTWKDYLVSRYGITLTDSDATLPSLITHFKRFVRGYILYDMSGNPQSLNVATSLSGPLRGLPVDRSQLNQIRSLGLTRQLLDVSDKNEKWAYQKYRALFSTTTAVELNVDVYNQLRDYATLTNSFTFYDGVTDWRGQVLDGLGQGATLLGYGPSESDMIRQASREGVTSIPTDLASNLSVLCSIHSLEGLTQKAEPPPATKKKHYVSFVVSDGDNVAWDLRGLQQYYGNADRGSFSVGYGVSPSLVDLAPSAIRWYYENASSGEAKDQFIAGPSGGGYVYPSRMLSGDLDRFVGRLNANMGRADLSIAEILDDQNSFDRSDLWSKYLRQPNIDALFYFGPDAGGRIGWVDNKPVVGQRDTLWAGVTDESTLIREINSRPASPTTADGYTLVLVHCWTKSLSDIKTVVDGLGPDVEVVTPQEFVSLIAQNYAQ
jgi:GxGYxYP putative glycoside hydrolase C-terminal domain/GxGYxYP third domain/GxGYxYP_N second domain/GxGYxYP_N 1st domain